MAPKAEWTLEELVRRVAGALASIDPLRRAGAPPSARTVRYYTDVGVVDGPSARRGLHAMYGQRHFLQLLGIKRLQARGLSLEEIRAQISGASTPRLTELAKPGTPIEEGRASDVQMPLDDRLEEDHLEPLATSLTGQTLPAPAGSASLQGFTLPGGVIVLLPGSRPLSEAERRSLRHAAGPLAALAARILERRAGDSDPASEFTEE